MVMQHEICTSGEHPHLHSTIYLLQVLQHNRTEYSTELIVDF